jgi:hypothetical protein
VDERPRHHLDHSRRLSAGGGAVFVPGSDSTLYAFGFDIEK